MSQDHKAGVTGDRHPIEGSTEGCFRNGKDQYNLEAVPQDMAAVGIHVLFLDYQHGGGVRLSYPRGAVREEPVNGRTD